VDSLIIQAYEKAKTKDFLAITMVLEKLLRRQYASTESRNSVTTGQVRRVLTRYGLEYRI
jgi:uncharacterized protein YbcC (UPF0753/DUF2309 family)